jgi:hypothetical protein
VRSTISGEISQEDVLLKEGLLSACRFISAVMFSLILNHIARALSEKRMNDWSKKGRLSSHEMHPQDDEQDGQREAHTLRHTLLDQERVEREGKRIHRKVCKAYAMFSDQGSAFKYRVIFA